MNINDQDHPVNRLSGMETSAEAMEQIGLTFFTVRKQKEADHYYRARESAISADVQNWLKKQIIYAFRSFQRENGQGEDEFMVSDYNFEVQKNDTLAMLELDSSEGTVSERKEGLLFALEHPDSSLEDASTHFQMIQIQLDNENIYCCFYRKPKRNIGKKKFAFKNSGELQFADSELLEIGGPIDFFIVNNTIYISSLRPFEYAFDYQDHINELRDENLERITALPFFDGEESNKEEFEDSCRQYFYSRSLAQIQPETIEVLQRNFEDRCEELKLIRRKMPRNAKQAEAYQRKYRALWELYDFIDLDKRKIVFHKDQEPKTLIQFFSDKIVQSFLTGDYGVAVSYENAADEPNA
ncbi:Kiwa anti-phage protein KwaB-like domain-containing protein [Paenibacillus dauci]|uniref:Kiwa anti-phage protein KwaB-like domain-containing protein n=1 Tax=Paenibacillus dauci TaxID=1567106 RepID=UPI000619EB76|nr:Kiwa anti-phage protein KwaB-like domain-containing protein [Paenibacillus dauci]